MYFTSLFTNNPDKREVTFDSQENSFYLTMNTLRIYHKVLVWNYFQINQIIQIW